MTTIVFDGRTMAADKQAADSAGLKSVVTKIYREGELLFGFAGTSWVAHAMRAWLRDGADVTKYPEAMKEDGNYAMVVGPAGNVMVYQSGPYPVLFEQKQHAIGSGRDFALAAMRMGRSAREAVLMAHEFDAYTGNTVDELPLAVATAAPLEMQPYGGPR